MIKATRAMQAVLAARRNGGSLFRRVAGCAEAVRLGWMTEIKSIGRQSTGSRGNGLSHANRTLGWVDREWRLTDAAPVVINQ